MMDVVSLQDGTVFGRQVCECFDSLGNLSQQGSSRKVLRAPCQWFEQNNYLGWGVKLNSLHICVPCWFLHHLASQTMIYEVLCMIVLNYCVMHGLLLSTWSCGCVFRHGGFSETFVITMFFCSRTQKAVYCFIMLFMYIYIYQYNSIYTTTLRKKLHSYGNLPIYGWVAYIHQVNVVIFHSYVKSP